MAPRRTASSQEEQRRAERKGPPIPPTAWPESLPTKNDDVFISVSCGNSNLHWATHHGAERKYVPQLFWRTKHFDPDEMSGPPSQALASHIPGPVHKLVFGSNKADPSKENALEQSLNRRVPCLTIYIVASNQAQADHVSYMWSEIPCRLYMLQGDDFFSKDQGRYEGMGVDRLCNLRGAAELYGYPILVIDGGTALTFTGLNSEAKIMGGTIGPGVLASVNTLAEFTEALPMIEPDELKDFLRTAKESKKPLESFQGTRDTRRAIMTQVLLSIATTLHLTICQFAAEIHLDEAEDDGQASERKPIDIVLCGGDAELFQMLLTPADGIVDTHIDLPEIDVRLMPKLTHYGIGEMLRDHGRTVEEDSKWETDVQLVGQRIAKDFDEFDQHGDSIFRGTVIAILRDNKTGESLYQILYDDNDKEDLTDVELYEALLLYTDKGERSPTAGDILASNRDAPRASKAAGARAAAKLMADTNKSVKAALEAKAPRLPAPPPPPPLEPVNPPVTAAPALAVEPPATEAPAATTVKTSTKRPSPPPAKAPAKKKAKSGGDYVGDRVAKMFLPEFQTENETKMVVYFGEIDHYYEDSGLWHVAYDDGDDEDWNKKDLLAAVKLYEKKKGDDTNRSNGHSGEES